MRPLASALIALSTFAGIIGASPAARGRADVVSIQVAAARLDGTVVTGLQAADFEILSDGQPCSVASIAADTPVTTLVLFNLAVYSTYKKPLGNVSSLERAIDQMFGTLRPADLAGMAAFDDRLFVSPAFSGERKGLVQSVMTALGRSDVNKKGASPIWDAIDAAVTALALTPGRHAILLASDGHGSGNVHGREEVATRAMLAGVAISVFATANVPLLAPAATTSPVVIPAAFSAQRSAAPDAAMTGLQQLASTTGGAVALAENPRNAGSQLAGLLTGFNRSYALGFVPPVSDGKVHALEVRVRKLQLTVRAPRAYLAPSTLTKTR
jgi:VWFA-related protein